MFFFLVYNMSLSVSFPVVLVFSTCVLGFLLIENVRYVW
jgi:hypothetical protein